MTRLQLARTLEATLLKPDATADEVERLCREAVACRCYAVCVHGSQVLRARHLVEESSVKVCCPIGFPLGACDGDVKRFEAETAVEHGALELDVVINLGRLKDGDDRYVLRELRDVVEAADGLPVKAILETGMLARDEKTRGCHLAVEAGCQFVKTSTGFLGPGATVADVALLRETVGPKVGVKASGGIRTLEIARQMLAAGASRIGTSAATAILEELEAREASL